MDDKKNTIVEIDKYYSSIDKSLLTNLCQNNNLKNLINLSTQTDIYIFNKKNKKWQLKSKDKLLKECEQIKKKELKVSSSMLSNLAKLSNLQDGDQVKSICQNLENKISNIDKIISCINKLDSPDIANNVIEIQSNHVDQLNNNMNVTDGVNTNLINNTSIKTKYHTNLLNPQKYKPNIVSFDEITIKHQETKLDKKPITTKQDNQNNIINLKISNDIKLSPLSSDDYIECYGNC